MTTEVRVVVGRTEDGADLVPDIASPWHIAIQGMTRSGKSVFCYGFLGGLAAFSNVVVTGVDPTGILLNPWSCAPGGNLRCLGTIDMGFAAATLGRIEGLMDERIAQLLEHDLDKLEIFSPELPLLVVVLEEYPGTLSAAASADAGGERGAAKIKPAIVRSVRRLVQEGAKVGIRVVILAQRMDAEIVGGAERSNLGYRFSMRVDNSDAIRMLHPHCPPDLAVTVPGFAPGVMLVDRPGMPMTRARADLTDYATYVRRVRSVYPTIDERKADYETH